MDKKFSNRVSTNTNRRRLKIISKTDSELVADIARADQDIIIEGSPITADVLNDFEERMAIAEGHARDADTSSQQALTTANTAKLVSEQAIGTANNAQDIARAATDTSNQANLNANTALEKSTAMEQALADRIKTITIGNEPVDVLAFDSDPQSQINAKANQSELDYEVAVRQSERAEDKSNIEAIINNTTLISNIHGGVAAGTNAEAGGTSIALGLNAQTTYSTVVTDPATNSTVEIQVGSGNVAIGENAQSFSGESGKSVAVGYQAVAGNGETNNIKAGSVAVGDSANSANLSIAIGKSASALGDSAVAIGNTAQASAENTIQLGKGANTAPNTLQVLDDNIYNAASHTLTVQNLTVSGVDLNAKINAITGHSAQALETNADLNSLKTASTLGWYYADTGNTVQHKPTGVDAFGLEVGRSANAEYYQILMTTSTNIARRFLRSCLGDIWTEWKEVVNANDLSMYLPLAGGTITGELAFGDGTYKITNNGAGYNGTAQRAKMDEQGNVIADTYAQVIMNGMRNTNPSFYAPADSGQAGQVLKSNGSGAPTWKRLEASDIPNLSNIYLTYVPQASSHALGGIMAAAKTSEETNEVKIDLSTGKLFSKKFPEQLPASDVYAWAKAASKPSYDYSEIINAPGADSIQFLTDALSIYEGE